VPPAAQFAAQGCEMTLLFILQKFVRVLGEGEGVSQQ